MQHRESDKKRQKCEVLKKATQEYLQRHLLDAPFDANEDEFRCLVFKYGGLIDEIGGLADEDKH